MIEIVLNEKNYTKFTAEAKKRMYIKGWSVEDLAKNMKRSSGTIRNFFSQKQTPSRFLAAEIADALDMDLKDWK